MSRECSLLEANGLYRRKEHLEIRLDKLGQWDKLYDMIDTNGPCGVHKIDNLPTQVVVPHLVDAIAEDGARLLRSSLGSGASGLRPLLLPRTIDQRMLRG